MKDAVPSKNDSGAVMFWSYHNKLQGRFAQLDSQLLRLMREGHEYRRRSSALEEAVASHRKLIFHDQQAVRMFCIACHYEFDVQCWQRSEIDPG